MTSKRPEERRETGTHRGPGNLTEQDGILTALRGQGTDKAGTRNPALCTAHPPSPASQPSVRDFTVFRPTSQPAAVSQMLAGDTRLLGQK